MSPRPPPDPREELLSAAKCMERLDCGEDRWREVREHPVIEAGRRGFGANVRWLASALARYMVALPKEPTSRPPAAGRGKRVEVQS